MDKEFVKSRIIFLPFINNPPSAYETVLTTLRQTERLRLKVKLKDMFITFDQPLYQKARELKEVFPEEFQHVHIRLSGFHTIMSFMGCIGFIMKGSGLKESLCEIYSENSVDKILSGHYYARAIRAFLLANVG